MADDRGSPPSSPPRRIFSPPTSPFQRDQHDESSSEPEAQMSGCDSLSEITDSSASDNEARQNRPKKRKLWRAAFERRKRRLSPDNGPDSDGGQANFHQDVNAPHELHGDANQDVGQVPLHEHVQGRFQGGFPLLGDVRSDIDSSSSSSDEGKSRSSDSDSSDLSRGRSLSATVSSDSENSENDGDSDSSGESIKELYAGSDISSKEGLLKILKLYVEERWTKTSLDKNLKLVKKLLPQPNEVPSNGPAALKKLEELTSSCEESEFLYCDECLQLVDENGRNLCHPDAGQSKFYSFPVDEQIKHIFEQRNLATKIDLYRDHESKIGDHICDIIHGSEYKKVKEHVPGLYDLVLQWNTDGVAMSSSSNQELWPILCTICEVAPRLRSSFVMVAGVYVGSKAPDMSVFLKPFTESLKKLFEDGVQWVHPVSADTITSKIVAPVVCADAPAKAHILNCMNFNASYGCLICQQKTKRIELPVQENDPNARPRIVRRFVYENDTAPAQLRTGAEMDVLGKLAARRGKPRKGVLGDSVISEIPFLDRASCLSAEYMHLLLLGVVRYLLLRIFTKAGPWFLGNRLEEINFFIMKGIKVPDFVCRIPRKLKDIKYWKASELRSFLLYFSLAIFKEFGFPENYYQHWLLLVGASHILLQPAISENDLQSAELMLRAFVRDIGPLYGEKCYTYNIHNLLHLCLLVRRWGPLWATSAFVFESFNGYLGAHAHGTKNLGKDLIINIKISQSVAILENILSAPLNELPEHVQIKVLGKRWSSQILKIEERAAIDSSGLNTYVLYLRVKYMTQIYTSKHYDYNKKRANSYVKFRCPDNSFQYGQIIIFVKTQDGLVNCLVKALKVVQVNLLFHEQTRHVIINILPVEKTNNMFVVPIHCIETKVLLIGKYVAIRPNSYEVNL